MTEPCQHRWPSLVAAYTASTLFVAGLGLLVSVSCGVVLGAGWRAFTWAAGD